jgi:hypothetical protein
MEEPFDHLVYSKNVIEFVTVTKEFCHFLENTNQLDKKTFIGLSLRMIPLLYLKTSVLTKPDVELNDPLEKVVGEDDYNFIKDSIEQKLGKHNDYLEVFNADIDRSDGALSESIAEDLADIYQDLKDFLSNYRSAVTEIMNDALAECIQNFEVYWGQKAVNCLRALHNTYYSGDELGDDDMTDDEIDSKRNTDDWIFTRRQKEWDDEEQSL